MERILRRNPRAAPRRRNRMSGANALASSVPCVPGESQPLSKPGEAPIDTVALCDGDMGGDFFWLLAATGRLTQWTQCHAVWNRGAANTKQALAEAGARFPFPLFALRSDSGSEFHNTHMIGYARERETPPAFSRSRPDNKNGNARVEQKRLRRARTPWPQPPR